MTPHAEAADVAIATERLNVRSWREADRAPFHALNSDPRVMATLGPVMTRAESDALVDRLAAAEAARGCTFWAVERRADGAFLGFCGVRWNAQEIPIRGMLEIGWRLGHAHWGSGYASEAAAASLDWAWRETEAACVVAITSETNTRSQAVMARIGMERLADGDFDHPAVPEGDRLRRHLICRIDRPGRAA